MKKKTKREVPLRNGLVEAMRKRHANTTKVHRDKRERRQSRDSWRKEWE